MPVPLCVAADTRNSPGPFGGPSISSGTSRDFNIPGSACGVPSNALAYSLNVAVYPPDPLGYITVWPTGQTRPTVATLNSSDGRIKTAAAIVQAGTAGSVSVFASNTTDVVVGINGYFTEATNPTPMAFYQIAPCRIADTRKSTYPAGLGAPSLTASQDRTFPILSSACGIPSTAAAYSLNFTVVPPGALASLTAWPTGRSQPAMASVNAPTGTHVSNAAIIAAGISGNIDVIASDNTCCWGCVAMP